MVQQDLVVDRVKAVEQEATKKVGNKTMLLSQQSLREKKKRKRFPSKT